MPTLHNLWRSKRFRLYVSGSGWVFTWPPEQCARVDIPEHLIDKELRIDGPSGSSFAIRAIAHSSGHGYRLNSVSPLSVSIPEPDGYCLILAIGGTALLRLEAVRQGSVALILKTVEYGDAETAHWAADRLSEAKRHDALLQSFITASLTSQRTEAKDLDRFGVSAVDFPSPVRELKKVQLDFRDLSSEELALVLAVPDHELGGAGKPVIIAAVGTGPGLEVTLASLREAGEGPWLLVDATNGGRIIAASTDGLGLQDLGSSSVTGSLCESLAVHLIVYLPAGARLLPGWLAEIRRMGQAKVVLLGGIEDRDGTGQVVLYGELDPVLLAATPAFGLAVAVDIELTGGNVVLVHGIEGVWALIADAVAEGHNAVAADAVMLVSPPWPMDENEAGKLVGHLAKLVRAHISSTRRKELPSWPHVVFEHDLDLTVYPTVSVIIPTHDAPEQLAKALKSIWDAEYPSHVELVLVAHRMKGEANTRLLEDARAHGAQIVRDDGGFNFSRLVNRGAAVAQGEIHVIMNDDVYSADPMWLRELVATHLGYGAVITGARLLTGDAERFQHLGQLRSALGTLQHLHVGRLAGDIGYCGRAIASASTVAVTGALMVVNAAQFREVGGFDELFEVAFGDSDLALRLKVGGGRAIVCATTSAIHPEQTTRGSDATQSRFVGFAAESMAFRYRHGWKLATDRCFSPLVQAKDSFLEVYPAANQRRTGLVGVTLGPEDMGGGIDLLLLPSELVTVLVQMPEDMPDSELVALTIDGSAHGGADPSVSASLDGISLSLWSKGGMHTGFESPAPIPTRAGQVHRLAIEMKSGWMKLHVAPATVEAVITETTRDRKFACQITAWVAPATA